MVRPVWIGSPHFFAQSGIKKRHIDLHWMVGNLRGTDAVFNGSRPVSTQYGVENGVVHQYVNEKDYSFGNGNTYANRYGVTIEHAGGWMQANGKRFKPTAATHETSAQLCADIARRWGMGKLVVGKNVFPHNHWVATQCPGSLDINWIVARANAIMGEGGDVGSTGTQSGGVSEHIRKVQKRLIELGYDLGSWGADGEKGGVTDAAIKAFQRANGLDDDGIPGTLTSAKLWPSSRPSTKPSASKAPAFPLRSGWYFGPQSGPVHSVSGYHGNRENLRRWQERMRDRGWTITADGLYGDQTGDVAEAFQREKGLKVDRHIGKQTWDKAWTAPVT